MSRPLVANGAVLVDTRIESEYKDKHIPGALWLPYGEKSLKDVAFDARVDSFPGLAKLDREQTSCSSATAPSAGSRTRPAAPRSPPATSTSTGSAAACPSGSAPASARRSPARRWLSN